MKKNTNSIALFSAINVLIKNIKPNYIIILFYFLFITMKFITFKKYIIKIFKIWYKKKIIMLNMKDLNMICAILYATYIKTIFKKYFIIK